MEQNHLHPISNEKHDNLIYVNFEHKVGKYTAEDFKSDWRISPTLSSGLNQGRLNIVIDPRNNNNKVLEITYLADMVGSKAGTSFNVPINGKHKALWLQYNVLFSKDFMWIKGGKLPGLAGGDHPSGCVDNGSFDGFSSRLMWKKGGGVVGYLYYPEKESRCGDNVKLNFSLKRGVWYTLTQYVKLNDIGKRDGIYIQYIDDKEVVRISDIKFRNKDDVFIDAIKWSSFFGGSTLDWAPPLEQHSYFDNFIVSVEKPDGIR
ncbi:polysaccharide lyase [Xenorhabdus hominickii]|uniref:Polysaccharide lyase 14 domain-containing protein n=1 Tax=Xenorhabdus hominickii TaxID=351679 RepID=A0A2G0QFX3_XENHO|nr:hypothetical protein [Xenorhabdus hominickii]AOM42137.1 hypothetical protein A9255_17195 [Xenorhabdus hominickii]PHM58133.1 hypothetical protein Xhom_01144 [Xenorhabdus hominickii]